MARAVRTSAGAAAATITTPVPKLAHGRALADFMPPLPAEEKLREACRMGDECVIDTELPSTATGTNTVRAGFVRFLALGGDADAPVHEHGVMLRCAWVEGVLDLDDADALRPLMLFACRIEQITARDAGLKGLALNGSRVEQGINADRLQCVEGIFLAAGCHISGEVRLLGATISGDLTCGGGKFDNPAGCTLNCDGARVTGTVFLNDNFESDGEVRLLCTSIERNLICEGGLFKSVDGVALRCDRTSVTQTFAFFNVAQVSGTVDLGGMEVGTLVDEPASWQKARGALILDGFRYDRIVDVGQRIAWLDSQIPAHLGTEFRPQPWEQLIDVLRAMGHPGEARKVAMAKQDRLRTARRISRYARPLHWAYGKLVGYGYEPMKLVGILAGLWLFGAAVFWIGTNPWARGEPATADHYWIAATKSAPARDCLAARALDAGHDPSAKLPTCPDLAPSYREFAALPYALDVLLPVINLGYKSDWQPVQTDAHGDIIWSGWWLQRLYWALVIFGWIGGLLLVGVLGNLIKKD
jgi:hypothetical protein